MITAVLDANTFVSATITPGGIPRTVVLAAHDRRFRLVTSVAIAAEVRRVLRRPRIRDRYGLTEADVQTVQDILDNDARVVVPTSEVVGVAAHREDDLVLATAVSGQADYLVTGDRQLLALGSYESVRIVTPREFLAILDAEVTQ